MHALVSTVAACGAPDPCGSVTWPAACASTASTVSRHIRQLQERGLVGAQRRRPAGRQVWLAPDGEQAPTAATDRRLECGGAERGPADRERLRELLSPVRR